LHSGNLLPTSYSDIFSCTLSDFIFWKVLTPSLPKCSGRLLLFFPLCLNFLTSANNLSIPFLYSFVRHYLQGGFSELECISPYITSETLWDSVTNMLCLSVLSNLSVISPNYTPVYSAIRHKNCFYRRNIRIMATIATKHRTRLF